MESFFEVRTKGDTWLTPAWPRGSLWGIPGPGLRDPHYEILSGTHTKCMSPVLLLLFFNVCYLHLLCLETKLPPCSVKYQVLVFPSGGPFLASQSLPSLSLEGLWGRRIPAPKKWCNTGRPAFQPLWVLQEVGVGEGLLRLSWWRLGRDFLLSLDPASLYPLLRGLGYLVPSLHGK